MITYDYAPSGKVTQRTNRRGWVTDYAYDDLYRMTTKTAYDDSEVEQAEETFTFDGLGRMLTAQKEVSSTIVNKVAYAYNALSKVTDACDVVYGQAVEIDYAYDQAGMLVQIDCPDANQLITRDPLGRIDSLTINDVEAVTYQYLGNRAARREYVVPDVDCDTDYNNLGQPTRVRTYGTTDITNFAYTYDASGNIVTQEYDHRISDPCSAFTYDNLDRLTRADYGVDTTNEQFTMDDIGNRSNVTLRDTSTEAYVADPCTNAYTSVAAQSLSHDDSGNRTVDRYGYSYTYDYENRLVKITRDPAETVVAEFAYDALGRRMQRKDNIANETIRFYHDLNWQVLLEQNDAAVDQRWYVYGNSLDERLIMLAADAPYDHYYAHDHLGSSVALMEPNAAVEERYEYDAYGTVSFLNADYSTQATQSSDYDNPYLFTGRALDILDTVSLKLQHNRHRNYDAVTGRFTTVDPFGTLVAVGATKELQEDSRLRLLRESHQNRLPTALISKTQGTGKPSDAMNVRYWKRLLDRIPTPLLSFADGTNLYAYTSSCPIRRRDSMGLVWERVKKIWECEVSDDTEKLCECLPKKGARPVEMHWCNGCVSQCAWMCIDKNLPDHDCFAACNLAHKLCIKTAWDGDCEFEFEIWWWVWRPEPPDPD